MKLFDTVRKTSGHGFEGVIVAVYLNLDGEERVVAECTAPGFTGWQMIFRPDLLEVTGRFTANKISVYQTQKVFAGFRLRLLKEGAMNLSDYIAQISEEAPLRTIVDEVNAGRETLKYFGFTVQIMEGMPPGTIRFVAPDGKMTDYNIYEGELKNEGR